MSLISNLEQIVHHHEREMETIHLIKMEVHGY
jgi:hypothetical protein